MRKYSMSELQSVLDNDSSDRNFLFHTYQQNKIPFLFRDQFHQWIDGKSWTEENEHLASDWYQELLKLFQGVTELYLISIKTELQTNFQQPLDFFHAMQACLDTEDQIIETYCKMNQTSFEKISAPTDMSSLEQPFHEGLLQIQKYYADIENGVQNMKDTLSQDNVHGIGSESKRNRVDQRHIGKYTFEKLFKAWKELLFLFTEASQKEIDLLISAVTAWKEEQKFPIGKIENKKIIDLDSLQNYYCDVYQLCKNCMTKLMVAVPSILNLYGKKVMEQVVNKYYVILLKQMESLVRSSVVIVEQPLQVLRLKDKESKDITMTVRSLLIPDRCTSVSYGEATVSFCNSARTSTNTIENNTVKFTMVNNVYSAKFLKMIIKGFKTLPSDVRVADQKYYLEVSLKTAVKYEAMREPKSMSVEVRSLSIVARTSHTSQEVNCYGSISWDNACRSLNETPDNTPRRMPWQTFVNLLKIECHKTTGRSLTPENIRFFKEILIGCNAKENLEMTWKQFNEDTMLPTKAFTFWRWYCATLNLLVKCLPNVWKDGLIIGYISKERTKELLQGKPNGTFLLRFSVSYISRKSVPYGGLSFAVITSTDNEGEPQIGHGNPFKFSEMFDKECNQNKEACFGLILRRMLIDVPGTGRMPEPLKYLYPDTEIDKAFEDYMNEEDTENVDGYLPRTQEQTIRTTRRSSDSFPLSPESSSFSDACTPLTPSGTSDILSPASFSSESEYSRTEQPFPIPELPVDMVTDLLGSNEFTYYMNDGLRSYNATDPLLGNQPLNDLVYMEME